MRVIAQIIGDAIHFAWKPVKRAREYTLHWLDKDGQWLILDLLEGDSVKPAADGLIHWVDETPGPIGPGGTYRVAAHARPSPSPAIAESAPVSVKLRRSARPAKRSATSTSPILARLKRTRHGWTTLLPREMGQCFGKRIEVRVEAREIDESCAMLLQSISLHLPKLAQCVERKVDLGDIEDEAAVGRVRVWINADTHRPGEWTIVVTAKGSDYAWHIEFNRLRVKDVRAGD
jgi:hypothetical protein